MLILFLVSLRVSLLRPMDRTEIVESMQTTENAISSNTFQAYDCNDHSSDISTARFSLNAPPACRSSDGSAYHPPEKTKAQILQQMERIPIQVTSCQVEWRVLVGWCGTSGAWNFMHSFLQTHQALIKTTKAQCYHSGPNRTLEVEIPPYGNINRIRVLIHLVGGVGQVSYQPVGYSRPNSDCRGAKFKPPPNKKVKLHF